MKNAIAAGFKGKLLTGSLVRATGSTVNEYGDVVPGSPQTFRVEGFPDEYNDMYRQQAGIPETDVKLILIAGNSQTEPQKDDKVTFANFGTFQIRKVKTDPAKAHFECQAFKV